MGLRGKGERRLGLGWEGGNIQGQVITCQVCELRGVKQFISYQLTVGGVGCTEKIEDREKMA